MARTILDIINDVIRQIGPFDDFSAEWKIPVEHGGAWDCHISIALQHNRDEPEIDVSVSAYGSIKGDNPSRAAHYYGLSGVGLAGHLSRRWIKQVLAREIEIARLAAMSFTEADLQECRRLSISEADLEEHWQRQEYFDSTLAVNT